MIYYDHDDPKTPSELAGYDWYHAFAHAANEDRAGNGCCGPEPAVPGLVVGLKPFDRHDVKQLLGVEAGEHDGADWICYGELNDGRFFSLRAGCDYTGWDCRSGGSSNVALTRQQIEQFGLTEDERRRLQVKL